eukprot:COSAG02_NODE_6178_length_3750_cov_2.117776_1_plen_185_part_00
MLEKFQLLKCAGPSKYTEYWMKLANLRRQLNLIDSSLMSDQAFFLQYKNGLHADMIKKIMFDNDYEDNALDISWFHQFFQKQQHDLLNRIPVRASYPKLHIRVKKGVVPAKVHRHKVPIHLKEELRRFHEDLYKRGFIERVYDCRPTRRVTWASSPAEPPLSNSLYGAAWMGSNTLYTLLNLFY